MFHFHVYRLLGDIVVEFTAPAPVGHSHARPGEPIVLARHQTALWDDCVDAQVGNIICELLEEAPNYGTELRRLLS